MKKLGIIKVLRGMIYILPAVLYLSYYPVISLGMTGTMNLELSVPIIWLVVFDMLAVIGVIKTKKTKVIAGKWYYYLFPFFVTISLFWSSNLLRGLLTVGLMWAVVIALMAFMILRKEIFDAKCKKNFWKWFFGASLVACLWCFIQCILDLAGVSRECSLLCLGCTYKMFGFPHPNGFAVEPQFMGNLLLAPTIISAAIMTGFDGLPHLGSRPLGPSPRASGANSRAAALRNTPSLWQFRHPFKIVLMLFVFATTLFLTFSRGAIYAFVVAMIFMSSYLLVKARKKKIMMKRVGLTWAAIVVSFLFTLNIQGIMTEISPTDDNYVDGVSRVISQLSLGVINIKTSDSDEQNRDNSGVQPVENSVENSVDNLVENSTDEASFDGYVPESTDVRVKLTNVALELWKSDIKNILFGVGIGGAGQALYDAGLIDSPKEIVQNEYASLLLEVGIIGVLFALLMVVTMCKWLWIRPGFQMVLPLIVAYLVSLCFFSGLPNALHIYLLPAVLCLASGGSLITRIKKPLLSKG